MQPLHPYDYWSFIGLSSPLRDAIAREERQAQDSLRLSCMQAWNAQKDRQPIDPISATWKLRDVEQNARNAEREILWRVKLRFIR